MNDNIPSSCDAYLTRALPIIVTGSGCAPVTVTRTAVTPHRGEVESPGHTRVTFRTSHTDPATAFGIGMKYKVIKALFRYHTNSLHVADAHVHALSSSVATHFSASEIAAA